MGERAQSEAVDSRELRALAHHLRTPLTVIRGYADMLAADELTAVQQSAALQSIVQKSKELSEVIDAFLDKAHAEQARLPDFVETRRQLAALWLEYRSLRKKVASSRSEPQGSDFEPPDGSGFLNAAQLNPRFQFQYFVAGNNSRLAHAAAMAVAERPGAIYNPLFLYGGVGLGKTHLMHAISHAVVGRLNGSRVAYVTGEKFMIQVVLSIQRGRMDEFRSRFRTVDLLLVDDIEFLAGKEATQEEFFHTFNVLYQQNRQIVISSDRPPSEILPLEARLRSRFQSGLIADIQPPDFETRLAILKSKIATHTRGHWIGIGHLVPEEVLLFIASRIKNNIRELEGALIRLLAHAALHRGPITVELASKLLRDLLPPSDPSSPDMNSLSRAVASFYRVGLDEIRGKRRDTHVILPRQVAMYLIREETGASLQAIGQAFGGRVHTTVLHSCERIAANASADPLRSDLQQIRDIVHAQ